MKKHVTIKLTAKMLRDHDACPDGIVAIQPYLPLTLSTNPEENVKIALVLADSVRAHQGAADAYWANGKFADDCIAAWEDNIDCASTSPELDAWQVMQHLAWVADAIATKEGR